MVVRTLRRDGRSRSGPADQPEAVPPDLRLWFCELGTHQRFPDDAAAYGGA